MKPLTQEQQEAARDAIHHVLNAIAGDSRKFWLMGDMTGSYEKLTKAAALIWERPVETVKAEYRPREAEWKHYCEQHEANERLLQYCRENKITGEAKY